MKRKVMIIEQKIKSCVKSVYWQFRRGLEDNSGMSVVELLLILVVIIALVLIFKTQLTDLVNTIFEKITSESAGI
ncbi:MAG: Flp1 family type IVb pilin [Schaedlerella sp.]|nr:Flp1 family type IVb pilin [Schaedlerella sp.]